MKKIITILTFLFWIQGAAFATECTEYLSKNYSASYNTAVEINSQKEYIDKYENNINNQFISSIIYGKGYFKQENKRKQKITYLCTLKDYKTITWGYVLPR